MIKRLLMAAALSGAVAFGFAGPASSADKDTGNKADTEVKPDNSKMNKEMRSNKELTADQQAENPADRKLAQQIRRSIVKDKSLSTYGHNVKVIVRGGNVTLKGPVRSMDEKAAVEKAAAKAAGGAKISNELTVAKKETKQEKKEKKDMKEEQKEK
jgi:hyperosmotically inducible periplasmic protein